MTARALMLATTSVLLPFAAGLLAAPPSIGLAPSVHGARLVVDLASTTTRATSSLPACARSRPPRMAAGFSDQWAAELRVLRSQIDASPSTRYGKVSDALPGNQQP